MTEEINIIDIHSDEVNDIIGSPPPWILFRGNIIIAIIFIFLLLGAWFLKYPDIISAPVLITTSNPPIKIVAQANGKIVQFNFTDGDEVMANKIIAIIDNPSNLEDMIKLKRIVETIDSTNDIRKTILGIKIPQQLQVAELQSDYSGLYDAISNYNFFLNNEYYEKKLDAIGKQEKNNNQIAKTILDRQAILNDQLKMEGWKDSAYKTLLNEKIISLSEYNEIRKSYLLQNLNNKDNSNTLLENKQQQREFQKTYSDIQQQYKINEKDIIFSIRSSAKKLLGKIGIWEKQYVIKAPTSGKLVLSKIRKINQYVNFGNTIFILIPPDQNKELRVQMPIYKAGKIKVGQKVFIRLHEYPYEEFGMLIARVSNISNLAIDSSYSVELNLVNGLKTTRNQIINSKLEMSGTADIVTNSKSLLRRLFDMTYAKTSQGTNL